MAAATFSAAGRRLLSTAAAAAEKTELPVPIAQLRRLARAGRLADIDAALAPLLPSHTVAALSSLSSVGLPHRAEELWRAMVQDHGIAPDAAAYNSRITYKSANGTVDKVRELSGQYANLFRAQTFASRSIPVNFHQLIRNAGISTTRNLLADDAMVPISSPLTPPLGDGEETDKKGAVVKRLKVQAIKKDIKQSPKKVNLVAKLVRGMRVEDALLQLQVTVKRAAKTVYQVIHSARANAAHNHGLDPDKLIVEEAFVGKGLYLKRLSYHAKGRCGVMVRPRCRLTVVVREATAEEEAKIAKLRVSNYKKLTRKERQLMPHRLIEVSPRWARKRKEEAGATA
ncbi:hypothetical protein SETIT_9G203600v2 [Setaria italica]|uniref:Large ribosomal subunit protein uL22c n=3 Tax=Setaria italica TaxID=4555 RepID=A0A368SIU1_SETIT|nr:uncharacterized protein LOC101768656 [Setaria italica]RCV42273.1 hypothetical protein SETIT_9G203600v2 [Setaria italica]RCV42274.1 hypothetical protein SETIT_9G203600v2 [Setaria italica]